MKYFMLVIEIVFCFHATNSSNILVFMPSPWKSHIISFQPLFLELAYRGHNMTVVTKYYVENPPENYKQIIASYDIDNDGSSDYLMHERSKLFTFYEDPLRRSTFLADLTKTFISDTEVQKFIREDQSSFDLVIVESFFQECTVTLGHKYGAPLIGIIPVSPWVSVSKWAGNPFDFSYIKDFIMEGGKSLNFWERFTNTYIGLYGLFVEPIIYLPKLEKMMDTYFQYPGYETRPMMTEMLKNISLSLIDSDVRILSSRPYVPNFIEVPGIHMQSRKNMNKKLNDFMNNSNMGVIYFNFGSVLNVTSIPKPSIQTLINVLGRLKQNILFRWINNEASGFPNNFYIDSWFPQREILNHPNCILFITHGGIHGIMESIDAGIPMLGLPVFGDQFQNLKTSQDNGIAIVKNLFKLTENKIENYLKLLLTDEKYSKNAKRMSAIFKDRPMSALDTAVYWVEYVIRHKGAHHLRSTAIELTWYQYYLLDVIAFIVLLIFLFICICYFTIRRIIKLLLYNFIIKQKID